MKTLFYCIASLLLISSNCIGQTASFNWVKQMGGYLQDNGISASTDDEGNVITVGKFRGTADFDPGVGTFNLTCANGSDLYISKLDSNGNFVWAKSIALNQDYFSLGFTTDKKGNIIIACSFWIETDFDPGPGVKLFKPNVADGCILKLDPNGNFVWACHLKLPATGFASCTALGTDQDNNIYAGGSYYTDSMDIITSKGTSKLYSETIEGGYIIKLDASGSLKWAKSASGYSSYFKLAIDNKKNIFVTGIFSDTKDFALGSAVYNMTSATPNPHQDMFITKLDSNANLLWAKQVGGTSGTLFPQGDPSVDKLGNIFICGGFSDKVDFDPSLASTSVLEDKAKDLFAGFVMSLDKNGDFRWARQTGRAGATATDTFGNIYVVGSFCKTDVLEPKLGGGNITLSTHRGIEIVDFFVLMLDSWGNFVWAKQSNATTPSLGFNFNWGNGVAVNKKGDLYCTGFFQSTEFEPGEDDPQLLKMKDTLQEGSFASGDVFVIKYTVSGLHTSSINENETKLNSLPKIYPNPNSGELFISYNKPVRIIVTDIMGRTQLNTKVSKNANIASLADGIYFVNILDEMGNLLTVEKVQKISSQ